MGALTQLVDLSDIPGHSDAPQVKVNHDRGGTTETQHSQIRILARFLALVQKIFHSLHSPLTKTIGLGIQGPGCGAS